MEDIADRIEAIRRFNRFYTKWVGAMTNRYLNSPFSLTEARVLYELFHHDEISATRLRMDLSLDAGYLSRILKGFERRKLLIRRRSDEDGRQMVLNLTQKGQNLFKELNTHSHRAIEDAIANIPVDEQQGIVSSMKTIEGLLTPGERHKTPYLLRMHQPGDIGWVIQQHGMLYHHEYKWDISFESFVAEIAGNFIRNFDPSAERCWIAEKDGENIGSVFLVKQSKTIAKLRMLIVTPKARGLGVGSRLTDECIRFARQAGYKKIRLWTVSFLLAAKKIYQKAGFQLVDECRNHNFGHDLIDETWELKL